MAPENDFAHFAGWIRVRALVASRRGIGILVAGLPKATAALDFAEREHAGQRRTVDGAPFILHPIEVATLLYRAGAPDHVIAAGLLHDVIEKTSVDGAELRKRFGARVARIVLALTEDKAIGGYQTRKAALRQQVAGSGHDALMVFAADKISKARELRLMASPSAVGPHLGPHGTSTRRRKLINYQRSLELLEKVLMGSPLVGQLRSELHRCQAAEPAAGRLAGVA